MKTTDDKKPKYDAPALTKGLEILEFLSSQHEGQTLKEIAAGVNRTPTEIYRMLEVLKRHEYVTEDPLELEHYKLTYKLFSMSHGMPLIKKLLHEIKPTMHSLSTWALQSCHLSVYEHGMVKIISVEPSPDYFGYQVRLGSSFKWEETSSGVVLYALSPETVKDVMLREATSDSIKVNKLEKRMKAIEKNHYEMSKSILVEGITNITVPLIGHDGNAVAALSLPYLNIEIGQKRPSKDQVLKKMIEISKEFHKNTLT